jgi:hypothetical protein
MWLEMDKAKKNQNEETSKAKKEGGLELLIEHSQPEGRNGK